MFNTICRSQNSIQDWATLLVQLIVRGVVDLTNNSDLFTLLLDMLAILIHSALISDKEGWELCHVFIIMLSFFRKQENIFRLILNPDVWTAAVSK